MEKGPTGGHPSGLFAFIKGATVMNCPDPESASMEPSEVSRGHRTGRAPVTPESQSPKSTNNLPGTGVHHRQTITNKEEEFKMEKKIMDLSMIAVSIFFAGLCLGYAWAYYHFAG